MTETESITIQLFKGLKQFQEISDLSDEGMIEIIKECLNKYGQEEVIQKTIS